MNDHLAVGDITLTRLGNDVIVGLKDSQDQLILSNWFDAAQRIESIRFCDGSIIDTTAIDKAANNQAPLAVADAAQVREDVLLDIAGNVLVNDSDPDADDTLTVTTAGVYQGLYGTLTLAANGDFTYVLDNGSSTAQALGEGQSVSEQFVYGIVDGNGLNPLASSAVLTMTVAGSNDAPIVLDESVNLQEDTALTVTGNALSNDGDVDDASILAIATAGTFLGVYGDLSIDQQGGYSYSLHNGDLAVQSLLAGTQVTEAFSYTVSDGLASVLGNITVTVTGTNDAPTLEIPLADQTGQAGKPITLAILGNTFADIDQGDVLALSAQLANGDALPSWLGFDAATGRLSGLPGLAEIGDWQIQITATDLGGLSATDVFTLSIADEPPASLSGSVYTDTNNDGIKDGGEAAIAGVTVVLAGTDSFGNAVMRTEVTDGNGDYHFTGLRSGTYQLTESQPDGYLDGQDTAGSTGGDTAANDQISAIVLDVGGNGIGNNFGELLPASLGDRVWLDSNANGIQDSGEGGLAGVKVNLLDAAGSVKSSTLTDSNGNYLFNGLLPGGYALQIVTPTGYALTSKGQGGDDMLDSDFDPSTGKSASIALASGEMGLTWDAGLKAASTSMKCLTYSFKGCSATDGADGNIRTFTADGVAIHASAFSRDKATGAWDKAWLGSYSGGLGVTDGSEGAGGGNSHTVDNTGRDNYVLFEFSESVLIDKAYLAYVVNDSDLSVWIGTFASPYDDHLILNDTVLANFGFTEVNQTSLSSARWADLNAGGLLGNTLVIAADTTGTTPDDNFKIQQLKVCVPVTEAIASGPGVGTAGFWKHWTAVWDGNPSNDYTFNTKANFAKSDILYKVTDPVCATDTVKGLLLGDWNKNGLTDTDERTLFYSLAEAKAIISASDGGQDARYILGKQLVTSWLNVIAGNKSDKVQTDIDNGIEWLQNHTPNEGGSGYGDGNLTLNAKTLKVAASSQDWSAPVAGGAHDGKHFGEAIKNVLDYYNNTGGGFALDRDTGKVGGSEITLIGLQTYQPEFHL
ncbi:MAG: SdrD B-like domain-containing protein [Methylovulum miyakonense]